MVVLSPVYRNFFLDVKVEVKHHAGQKIIDCSVEGVRGGDVMTFLASSFHLCATDSAYHGNPNFVLPIRLLACLCGLFEKQPELAAVACSHEEVNHLLVTVAFEYILNLDDIDQDADGMEASAPSPLHSFGLVWRVGPPPAAAASAAAIAAAAAAAAIAATAAAVIAAAAALSAPLSPPYPIRNVL